MAAVNILTKKQVNEMIDKAIKQQSEKMYKTFNALIKHIYKDRGFDPKKYKPKFIKSIISIGRTISSLIILDSFLSNQVFNSWI